MTISAGIVGLTGETLVTALVAPSALPQPSGDAASSTVRLMPLGDMRAADGRRWRLGDAAAVIAASLADGVDLVIDFDHATEVPGCAAPAAGWITGLCVEGDHLVASVRWTDRGTAALRAREYRYLSPTFTTRKDGSVVRILRAALVNAPALPQLGALAKTAEQPGDVMPTDIETATARADAADTKLAAAREALGLAADADGAAITAAIDRLRTAEATLAGQIQALSTDVATLRQAADAKVRDDLIVAATRDGKLAPALAAWARAVPLDQLRSFISAAPVVIAAGARTDIDLPPSAGDDGLTAGERAVCAAMNLDQASYIAARASGGSREEVAR